jgi:ABC-type uncharacterized transport system substrate-binding protein
MSKKTIIVLLVGLAFVLVHLAEAQQPTKPHRIGVLFGTSRSFNATRIETFRQSLRELGYVEGKNVMIEYRYAEGKLDLLPALASELVHLKVDVIVTSATSGVLAAKNATKTIPLVFTSLGDPVGSGLVANLAARGERHGTKHSRHGVEREKVGATQGGVPQGHTCGDALESDL